MKKASIAFAVFALILCAVVAHAGTVTFQTDNYTDPIAKQFRFYSSLDCAAIKPWPLKSTFPIVTPSTYTVTGVGSGTSCWYVTATDAAGNLESAPSNTVTVNMPLAPPKNVVITVTVAP